MALLEIYFRKAEEEEEQKQRERDREKTTRDRPVSIRRAARADCDTSFLHRALNLLNKFAEFINPVQVTKKGKRAMDRLSARIGTLIRCYID